MKVWTGRSGSIWGDGDHRE